MKNSFYKKSISLMFITIVCQIINLLRDILLARNFGATSINDIYLVSQTIVSVIITMINSPMAVAFVPVTTKYYTRENDEKNRFVSMVYSNVLIIAIGLSLIEIFTIDGIVYLTAPGFEEEAKTLLKQLVLIQTPFTFINIIKGVNRGNFQILQRFNISELSNAFPYLCMCVYFIIPVEKSVYMIAIILTTASCISIIPEFILLHRSGFKFRFTLAYNKDIKTMVVLMIAAAITAGIREINVLCDKAFGSLLSEGSITMLSYASKLTVVVVGLVTASISLVGFTNTAKLKDEGKTKEILKGITDSCNLINFIIIPTALFLMVFSYDIINILYGGGDFSVEAIRKTSDLMKLYAVGLIGYGFQDVYTRSLHAYKIVRCTIKESAILVAINIALDAILYRYIDAYGIAIATSFSILVVIPILERDVRKHIGNYDLGSIIKEMIKTFGVSFVTALVGILMKLLMKQESIGIFLIESIVCLLVYLILSAVTKNKILINIINDFKMKRR